MRRHDRAASSESRDPPIVDEAVRAAFEAHPPALRRDLLRLRALIFQAAFEAGLEAPEESLKWGEPAYRPKRGGTTVRLNRMKSRPDRAALFVPCQTVLIDGFRIEFGELFDFDGNRAFAPKAGQPWPQAAIETCVVSAFTYHRRR